MALHNDLGFLGEAIAAQYMEQNGWYIRDRDWTYNGTDIDLICIDEDDTILVFVEVKTRSTDDYGRPEEAVDAVKRSNIIHAANAYLAMSRKENRNVRFDIISIIASPSAIDTNNTISDLSKYKITHIPNAFSLIDVFEDSRILARNRRLRNSI